VTSMLHPPSLATNTRAPPAIAHGSSCTQGMRTDSLT
jgi:hypothetical protein